MTATHTAPLGFPDNLFALMRRIANVFVKGMLAMAIVFMAGLIAVATAVVGLALAAFALILRLSGSNGRETYSHYDEQADGGTVTLEAKKTPRGWTVE